jgi:hypothetical protein
MLPAGVVYGKHDNFFGIIYNKDIRVYIFRMFLKVHGFTVVA